MNRYIIAPLARQDFAEIRAYYSHEAGPKIVRRISTEFVDAFRALAARPGMGHRRPDLAVHESLLFWPVREYLVV